MRSIQYIIIAALAVLTAGCGNNILNEPVAVADGHKITAGEMELKAKLYGLSITNKKEAGQFVNLLINDYLVLEEAKRMKVAFTGDEMKAEMENFAPDYASEETKKALRAVGIGYGEWIKDIREKVTRKKLINMVMKDKIKADPEEIKGYFWSNILDFRTFKKVRARQIVLDSEEKAKQVQQLLMRGEAFEKLAEKYSVTSEGKNGGDLGYFGVGEMPSFINDAVFSMKKGEISGIIRSPYGWHIFKCEDIQEEKTPKFEEVKDLAYSKYYESKKDEYFNSWMQDIRRKARITIYEETLYKLVESKEAVK
jgi:parvulin-like peptidyl-prolyl isomerase